jgi:hypothetical protein
MLRYLCVPAGPNRIYASVIKGVVNASIGIGLTWVRHGAAACHHHTAAGPPATQQFYYSVLLNFLISSHKNNGLSLNAKPSNTALNRNPILVLVFFVFPN